MCRQQAFLPLEPWYERYTVEMTTNDISSNGLFGSSSSHKHEKGLPSPRKKASTVTQVLSRKQSAVAPTGTVLKPVSSNFFYQHDETSKKATPSRSRILIGSREANEWKKRKAAEQDVGVPWMLGKPMNSGKGFMGSGALHDSKRIKLAPVDNNTSQANRYSDIGSPNEEFDESYALGQAMRSSKKQFPLFMPSPSPKKLAFTASQSQVSDKQAKQLLDDLLEGLDTDVGFFNDDLDSKSVDEGDQLGENGVGREFGKSDSTLPAGDEDVKPELEADFEMCDWMKVGPPAVNDETKVSHSGIAIDVPKATDRTSNDVKPEFATAAKSDPAQDTDSEYADEFDYDNINLDDLDLAANSDGTATNIPPTAGLVSIYPLVNPPIHDSLKSASSAYDPLPWRRCIVESVSEEDNTNHRFGQAERVVHCRVVESFAAHGSEVAEGEAGHVQVGTKLKCRLKGEWADLVLASGEYMLITLKRTSS